MSNGDFDWDDEIDLALQRRIDAVCTEFDRQWQAGKAPRIEDALEQIPAAGRARALGELIGIEIELRREAAEYVEIAHYLSRFAGQETIVEKVFAHADLTQIVAGPGPHDDLLSNSTPSQTEQMPTAIGRFPIEKKIGEGGFGIVYLAIDLEIPRPVALKYPRPDRVRTAEQRRDFLRDAQIAGNLTHPGIVTIYQIEKHGDVPFIVQEYMPGGDLRRRLEAGHLPVEQAVAWLIPIAEAVAWAHQQHTFHRDLKPANILLDARDQPRVADFGLALHVRDQQHHRDEYAGTLPYMSPEQVRRESNRLDGRSDTWSLGVIFYEMLTGQRPFQGTKEEIEEQIKYRDPRPLRELEPALPSELQRICLKCLERPVARRYSSALDLAQELRQWQLDEQRNHSDRSNGSQPQNEDQSPKVEPPPVETPPRIVPKGLRSFDARDAEFFLELLPGPRDRNGLPESVRFWKALIEETDPAQTFTVGVLHGPSGCGKSSFLKAGVLPKLAAHVVPVFVEATAADTEVRLLRGLRKILSDIPHDLPLPDVLAGIRDGVWNPERKKIVIALDQFEQWLHAGNLRGQSQLVDALRHCDGERLQCLVLVREDFWTGISRFMQQLEIPLQEQRNAVLVDRFDPFHARRVLEQFGRAYGRLPAHPVALAREQEQFLDEAIDQLSEEGRVICVRLALFSDLFRGKPWTLAALNEAGGADGLGVTFLEETFVAKSAPEAHRRHEKGVQKLLAKLLPGADTDIKGSMQTREELQRASGYADKPRSFGELIQILDEELRLVTPTDPEGSFEPDAPASAQPAGIPQYYQFTHDYLVPSVRSWLKLKERDTAAGRARQLLTERATLYQSRPEDRHLPSLWEHLRIRLLTSRRDRTEPQQKMLRRAARVHGMLTAITTVLSAAVLWCGYELYGHVRTENKVANVTMAKVAQLEPRIVELAPYRRWAVPMLAKIVDSNPSESEKRNASLALAVLTDSNAERIDYLFGQLLEAAPEDAVVIAQILKPYKDKARLTDRLWQTIAEPADRRHSLRAAAALAQYDPEPDPDAKQWPKWSAEIAGELVQVPLLESQAWTTSLRPVGRHLVGDLEAIYRDRRPERSNERALAAAAIADYITADPKRLVDLAVIAENAQELSPFVLQLGSQIEPAVDRLNEILDEINERDAEENHQYTVLRKWAAAAVCLMQLDFNQRAWRLLRHSRNPSVQSLLIQEIHQLGTPFRLLVERLDTESDLSAKQAEILSLGEFDVSRLGAREKQVCLQKISELYERDKDSGIHSAAEWALRKFERLKPIGETPPAGKNWYVNAQWQTMLIIPAPGLYAMGEMVNGQPPTPVLLDYTFAIAAYETTVAQFKAFRRNWKIEGADSPDPNSPIDNVSWYDAAAYCNWLSEMEGLEPWEWCYAPDVEGEYAPGMRIPANWRDRKGYRLPTLAEWEYVCRAGSDSRYAHGSRVELLDRYAWYYENSRDNNGFPRSRPVGRLRPNALGAFDMHGNAWELCHDIDPLTGDAGDGRVSADARCESRGGSFDFLANDLRFASKITADPGARSPTIGFRIALGRNSPVASAGNAAHQ